MQSISFSRVCPLRTVFILIVLFLAGCVGKHHMVPENERMQLFAGNERSDVYSKGPLTVDYKYQYSGSTFTVSGAVAYNKSVDSLDVRIVFLDPSGFVVGRKLVYSSGYRTLASREDTTRTFRTRCDVPTGAAGFIFTDSSVARASRP
jgi:hypothetical protein